MPRARAIQWELVLLRLDELDPDVANVSSVTMEVKDYNQPTSAPLISRTVVIVNAGLSDDQRIARSSQHVVIPFDEGETGLSMAGADTDNTKRFSVVITAVRNGHVVTLGDGVIRVRNDGGVYSGNTPTAGDPTYYTKEEMQGLLADFIKQFNEPGKSITLVSENNQWQVRIFVDNNGVLQTPESNVL